MSCLWSVGDTVCGLPKDNIIHCRHSMVGGDFPCQADDCHLYRESPMSTEQVAVPSTGLADCGLPYNECPHDMHEILEPEALQRIQNDEEEELQQSGPTQINYDIERSRYGDMDDVCMCHHNRFSHGGLKNLPPDSTACVFTDETIADYEKMDLCDCTTFRQYTPPVDVDAVLEDRIEQLQQLLDWAPGDEVIAWALEYGLEVKKLRAAQTSLDKVREILQDLQIRGIATEGEFTAIVWFLDQLLEREAPVEAA